jgi:hypothetical protein
MLKTKPIKVKKNSIYAGLNENNSVVEIEEDEDDNDPINELNEVDSEVNIEYNIAGATEEDEKQTQRHFLRKKSS